MIHLLPDDSTLTEACSDGLLLLDLASVRYTFLDRTGAQMWMALKQSSDVDEAVDRLCAIYAADSAVLQRDLLQFCDHLVAEGLAAHTPYRRLPEAPATTGCTEVESAAVSHWTTGLLGAVTRNSVAGDIVLLDAPAEAVAAVSRAMAQEQVDDRRMRLLMAACEPAAAVGSPGSPPDICLLWIHSTDADSLADVLPTWLARISPGGYVVVSGLEPHVLVDSVAAVAQPADDPEVVPVEWLTAWWQQR